jgi:hypothetical protein
MRTISNISDEDSDSSSSDEEDSNEEDENEKITGLFQDTPVKIDNNNIGPLTKF